MARVSRKQNTIKPEVKEKASLVQAAVYLRLSVKDNGKDDCDSIENQEMIVRNYLKNKPDIAIAKVFVENGHTGTVFDRPVFNSMMEAVESGIYNCVVVKDLSRFGRNALDATDYITNIFPEMGIRFISVRDNYDSELDTDGKDQMYIMIDNFINELYSKDISRKSCTVLRSKRKQGLYIGGYAPYGYKKSEDDKYVLEIDEEAAAVVRKIFEWRAEGQGYSEIYNRLNKMHIPSPTYYKYLKGIYSNYSKTGKQYPWSKHVLFDMLRNQTYIGDVVQGKQLAGLYQNQKLQPVGKDKWIIVEGKHEPIISKELFEAVQRVNETKQAEYEKNANKYNLPKVENVYTGYVFCGDCGFAMKMVRSLSTKKDKAYYNYKCGNYHMHGKDYCTPKKLRKADLDVAVLETIKLHIALFVDMKEELKRLNNNSAIRVHTKETLRKIKELQLQEDRISRIRTSLYDDYKDGLLTSEEFVEMRDLYSKQLDDIRSELKSLEEDKNYREIEVKTSGVWSKAVMQFKNPQEVTRELVEAIIDRIDVYDNEKIKITFKCMDEFERLGEEIKKRKEEVA